MSLNESSWDATFAGTCMASLANDRRSGGDSQSFARILLIKSKVSALVSALWKPLSRVQFQVLFAQLGRLPLLSLCVTVVQ